MNQLYWHEMCSADTDDVHFVAPQESATSLSFSVCYSKCWLYIWHCRVTSKLNSIGWDVEHGGVKLLSFKRRSFSIPALLQHLMHFLKHKIKQLRMLYKHSFSCNKSQSYLKYIKACWSILGLNSFCSQEKKRSRKVIQKITICLHAH